MNFPLGPYALAVKDSFHSFFRLSGYETLEGALKAAERSLRKHEGPGDPGWHVGVYENRRVAEVRLVDGQVEVKRTGD